MSLIEDTTPWDPWEQPPRQLEPKPKVTQGLTADQVAELLQVLAQRAKETESKPGDVVCDQHMKCLCDARAAGIRDAIYSIKLRVGI